MGSCAREREREGGGEREGDSNRSFNHVGFFRVKKITKIIDLIYVGRYAMTARSAYNDVKILGEVIYMQDVLGH